MQYNITQRALVVYILSYTITIKINDSSFLGDDHMFMCTYICMFKPMNVNVLVFLTHNLVKPFETGQQFFFNIHDNDQK